MYLTKKLDKLPSSGFTINNPIYKQGKNPFFEPRAYWIGSMSPRSQPALSSSPNFRAVMSPCIEHNTVLLIQAQISIYKLNCMDMLPGSYAYKKITECSYLQTRRRIQASTKLISAYIVSREGYNPYAGPGVETRSISSSLQSCDKPPEEQC